MSELVEVKAEPVEHSGVSCDQCGLTLENATYLKMHVDVAHTTLNEGKEYFCEGCQIEFSQESDLIRHQQTVHEKLRPFVCTICYSAHTTKQKLKEHISTIHEKKKPYECDLCEWKFGRSQGLAKHKQYVHNKEKPFTCPLCEKSVARKADLNTHIRLVHEQSKPHACSYCGKTFGTVSNLGIHIKHMHEKLAIIPCPGCDKMFITTNKQKQHHKQVHEKFRGFKCDFCHKGFATAKDKRRHTGAVHEKKKNFECLDCDKGYATYSDLKVHEQLAHGGEKLSLSNLTDSDVAREPLDIVEVSMNSGDEMDEQAYSDDQYGEEYTESGDENQDEESEPHIKEESISGSENSYFEEPETYPDRTYQQVASPHKLVIKLARAKSKQTQRSTTGLIQTDCQPIILEVYSSNSSIEPITHSEWIRIEKFLICELLQEITDGAISALQVKISKSEYDSAKMCGVIHFKEAECRNWYKGKVSEFRLEGKCFRAWAKEEIPASAKQVPAIYHVGLLLPARLSSVDDAAIMKLLASFNPQLNQFLPTVRDVQTSESNERTFILEVCKDCFHFIQEREWKLDFLMGEVSCTNLSPDC